MQRESLNAFIGEPWSNVAEPDLQSNEAFFRHLSKVYHQNIRALGYMAKGSFHRMGADDEQLFVGYYNNTKGSPESSEEQEAIAMQVSLFER